MTFSTSITTIIFGVLLVLLTSIYIYICRYIYIYPIHSYVYRFPKIGDDSQSSKEECGIVGFSNKPSILAVGQNLVLLVPLVNIKIAGKWMFIPLKMVLIGIDS